MQPRAWSHSALKNFETCPKKYYATTITKQFSEPPSDAMSWGSDVHKAFEEFLGKKKKDFPFAMKHMQPLADTLRQAGEKADQKLVEEKLALTRDFEPTGFFDKNVWCRSVLDYAIIRQGKAGLFDFKTGKKGKDDDQLALMAGFMFAYEPNLEFVDSTFVWLKEPKNKQVEKITFKKSDVSEIWNRFLPRVEAFENAFTKEEFPARPNGLCRRHCPVSSCPYHGS